VPTTDTARGGTDEHPPPTWLVGVLVASALVILVPIALMLNHAKPLPPASTSTDTTNTETAAASTSSPVPGEPGSADPSIQKGIAVYQKASYDEALKIFSSAAHSSSRKNGSVEALLWEGKTLNAMYRFSEGKAILLEYMKKADDRGVTAAQALISLARSCSGLGQTDEALGYLNRAATITTTLKGQDRLVHAQTLRGLGDVALSQKNYKKAKTLLTESLTINRQLGGTELQQAQITNDLGEVHQYLKEYDAARQCYNTALNIRQRDLSASSPEIAYTWMCLGSLDFQQNKLVDAEKHLSLALSIDRQNLGENNLEVALIEYCLGVLYERQRDYTQAQQYYYKSLATRTGLLGENDRLTVTTRNAYTKVLRLKKRK
jgi:tetratricopeptide (TPR) repeat protein